MKKRLVVWVFFIILSLGLSLEPSFAPGLSLGLMAQPGLGAASIAKGGVSLGEGDPLWALWNDTSSLVGARLGVDSAQFDSPNHETRLYAYEHDLRYQFSVSQWQGQGHQYYVLLNIRPFTAKLHIQLKYSQAEYLGHSAIGSGPTQVLGPTKREIKAQILLRW